MRTLIVGGVLVGGIAFAASPGKQEQRAREGGALRERPDPAADLKVQEENLEKLRRNAAADRALGNRVGAWAADRDAHHVEKLIAKDRKLVGEGARK